LGFRFIYTGIRVKNMDKSIRFYTEVMGMEVAEKREKTASTRGEVVTLRSPNSDQLLELDYYGKESDFYAPYLNGEELDHLAFDVENLESCISELRRKRIKIIVEPYKIGGWKEAFIEDPNGIWIELLQRK